MSTPIRACPRCGRALKDATPLGHIMLDRIPSLSSEDAARAWEIALRHGLGHDCDRYLVATFAIDGGAWTSHWPGRSGPPDLVTGHPPRTATVQWVSGGLA